MFGRNSTTPVGDLRRHLSDATIREIALETKALQRQRKVDIVLFFWNLILGFAVGKHRTIIGLQRSYENSALVTLEESSFLGRFTPELVKMLVTILELVLSKLESASQRLSGMLAGFKDLLLIDSTVIRLNDMLKGSYAGCRTNHSKSAAKCHAVLSVRKATASRVQLTPERTNDKTPWEDVGSWVSDKLLLFDLGYYCFEFFSRISARGGFFISRMKTNANPLVIRDFGRGGRDLTGVRLKQELGMLKRTSIDLDVELCWKHKGKARKGVFRAVGVWNEQKQRYHLYYTNIARDVLDASQISRVYRLRWQVELLFKGLKSNGRLDQLPSEKKETVEALMYATLITQMLSTRLRLRLQSMLPRNRHIPPLRFASVFESLALELLAVIGREYRRRMRRRSRVRLVSPWKILLEQSMDPNVARPYALAEVIEYDRIVDYVR